MFGSCNLIYIMREWVLKKILIRAEECLVQIKHYAVSKGRQSWQLVAAVSVQIREWQFIQIYRHGPGLAEHSVLIRCQGQGWWQCQESQGAETWEQNHNQKKINWSMLFQRPFGPMWNVIKRMIWTLFLRLRCLLWPSLYHHWGRVAILSFSSAEGARIRALCHY